MNAANEQALHPQARRFDLLTLFAEDMPGLVTFYRDVMGIRTKWDGDMPYAAFEHEGIRFAVYPRDLLERQMGVDATFPVGLNGSFCLSVNFDDPNLVDAEFERLVSLEVPVVYKPRDEPWGLRSAMVQDPEGNLIELASWLPEAG